MAERMHFLCEPTLAWQVGCLKLGPKLETPGHMMDLNQSLVEVTTALTLMARSQLVPTSATRPIHECSPPLASLRACA